MNRTPPRLTARLCGVALLAGLTGCGSPDAAPAPAVPDVPAPPARAIRATVERVVDGDTFIASANGRSLRVRLIGINAPESVQPDAPVECFGREAAVALGQLIPPGTTVSAAYEAGGPVDQFGRQLWDVWLDDGRFVQAELVRQGAAEARAYPPHTQHADLLERIEDAARTDDAGLFGACA